MNRLENLPGITEKALGGLTADETLKFRILKSAAESDSRQERSFLRPVIGLLSAAALMVLVLLVLNGQQSVIPVPTEEPVLHSFTAGSTEPDETFPVALFADGAESLEITRFGKITDVQVIADISEALKHAEPVNEYVPAAEAEPGQEQELIVRLKDGSEYRWLLASPFLVSDDRTWSCPRFFEIIGETN